MGSPVNTAFAVLSLLSVLPLLLISPLHWRMRNTGGILIFWTALGNLVMGICSIVWADTSENVSPAWADFSAAIVWVYAPGFVAGNLCILRKLEAIASTRQVSFTDRDRRNTLIIDLCIGIGLPILLLALRPISQGHRIDIISNYGVRSPYYSSIVGVFTYQIWLLGLGVAGFVYAGLILRWFLMRRQQFAAVLASNCTGLDKNKYIRLMILALVELCISFPLTIYIVVAKLVDTPLQPYTSWADVHEDWNTAWSYDISELDTADIVYTELGRWLCVAWAFTFVGFFGFTQEARAQYRRWGDALARASTRPFSSKKVEAENLHQSRAPQSEPRETGRWSPKAYPHLATYDMVEASPNLAFNKSSDFDEEAQKTPSSQSPSFSFQPSPPNLSDIYVTTERITHKA
ncbi:STE3 [Ceraceosorus bombacis]|uniref:STE3 n=1 Tax=Ceraceosorus bombacis TaxID=401625 RepID=A0A0N7L956_9BASI|nr:STE3 [Ceraceosorus bombacis]